MANETKFEIKGNFFVVTNVTTRDEYIRETPDNVKYDRDKDDNFRFFFNTAFPIRFDTKSQYRLGYIDSNPESGRTSFVFSDSQDDTGTPFLDADQMDDWLSVRIGKLDSESSDGVDSFNTRTGAVVPQSGDYNASQVTNAYDKSSDDADSVDDSTSSNKFATAAELSQISTNTSDISELQNKYLKDEVVVTAASNNFNSNVPTNVPGMTYTITRDGDYVFYAIINGNNDQNEELDMFFALNGSTINDSLAYSRWQKNNDQSIQNTFPIDGLQVGDIVTVQLNTRNDNVDLDNRRILIQTWG